MTTEGFKRRLSAILSADVKEYSRLMRDNEDETIRTLTTYRSAIAKLVQQYRGRVVDSPGDNVLAEFGSVVDAIRLGECPTQRRATGQASSPRLHSP